MLCANSITRHIITKLIFTAVAIWPLISVHSSALHGQEPKIKNKVEKDIGKPKKPFTENEIRKALSKQIQINCEENDLLYLACEDIEEKLGIPIVIDIMSLENNALDENIFVSCPAIKDSGKAILEKLIQPHRRLVTWRIVDGVVLLTTIEKRSDPRTTLHVYDCRQLIPLMPDLEPHDQRRNAHLVLTEYTHSLHDQTSEFASWDDEHTIGSYGSYLVVWHVPEIHDRIKKILADKAKTLAKPKVK